MCHLNDQTHFTIWKNFLHPKNEWNMTVVRIEWKGNSKFYAKIFILHHQPRWMLTKTWKHDSHTQTLVYVIILNYEQYCKKPNGFVFGVLVFMQTIVY